jgi:hypothetical protein
MTRLVRIPLARFLIAGACAATVVATSVTVAAASPAGTADAHGEKLVGTLVQAWTDDGHRTRSAEQGNGDPLSWIKPDDGDAVRVPTDDVDDLTVGDTVEIVLGDEVEDQAADEGVEPAREVLASEVLEEAPARPDPPTAAATYQADHHVTVVMVVPPGGTPDGVALADVVAEVNGPVAAFWSEQTHGELAISVVAQHDWITTTADCTDPFALWDEVADTVGWNLTMGGHLLLYVSSAPSNVSGCADGAGADFGYVHVGGLAYVRDLSTGLIAHEFGHMFGLQHSESEQCTGPAFTGNCSVDEYGDRYDVMGYSWDQLGSLNSLQTQNITWAASETRFAMGDADRTVTLTPVSQRSGFMTVDIDVGTGQYFLEYRPPSGRDAWLGTADNVFGLQSGVLLRQMSYDGGSVLLDPTPSPMEAWGDDLDVAMPVGTPVKLAGGAYTPGVFTVTVQSMSPTGAVVRLSAEPGNPAYDFRCEGWYRPNVPSSGIGMITVGGQTSALAVGTERALWLRPVDGAGGWQSLGGTSLYGPAGAVAGSTSYAFVVGGDQALWYRTDSGSGWGPWQTLGGRLTATPAAASLGSGHVRVFGRGGSGELWSREFRNGAWSAWMPHGGVLSAPPTASADVGAGLIRATVRGQDGSFFDLLFPAGGRTARYQVRDLVACSALAMTAVQSPTDAGEGVFLDWAGQPRVLDLQVASGLGGGLTSNPAVVFGSSDVLVAGRGNDGALWLYDGRAGLNRWVSLGGRLL